MLRIFIMALRMILFVPYYIIRLKQMQNFEKYDLNTRYAFLKKFVHRMVRNANVVVVADGMEKIPDEDGMLIAPNHQGMFDPFIIVETMDRPVTCVAKRELEKWPVVKDVIKMVPARTIDRSNLRESVKIIREVGKEIDAGRNYIIFPEGTRSKQGNKTGEFKGGTMKSATDHQKPIVPVALIDCFKPFDSKSIRKVKAEIHYLDPIYYDEYKDWTSIELAAQVQGRIQNKINEVLAARENK